MKKFKKCAILSTYELKHRTNWSLLQVIITDVSNIMLVKYDNSIFFKY